MAEIKETPLLFSAPMVRAILDGRKTQTRRALKVQPIDVLPMKGDKAGAEWVGHMQNDPPRGIVFRCKFGRPGDRLWVRETWAAHKSEDGLPPRDCSKDIRFYRECHGQQIGNQRIGKWRPSIHMPRWHSRILLEITGARVERLQDITKKDAEAEGVPLGCADGTLCYNPKREYRELWESINGRDSWNLNPWVWAIEFRKVEP